MSKVSKRNSPISARSRQRRSVPTILPPTPPAPERDLSGARVLCLRRRKKLHQYGNDYEGDRVDHYLHGGRLIDVADQRMQRATEETRILQYPRSIPHSLIECGEDIGLFKKRDRLRRHACGEKSDQRAGDTEQISRRNTEKHEIGKKTDQRDENEPGKAAHDHGPTAAALRGCNAVEEEHDFGALAQHRDRDHNRERQKRLRTGHYRFAGSAQLLGKLAAMPRHPDIVPG